MPAVQHVFLKTDGAFIPGKSLPTIQKQSFRYHLLIFHWPVTIVNQLFVWKDALLQLIEGKVLQEQYYLMTVSVSDADTVNGTVHTMHQNLM